jgi:hypothetical protein
LFIWREGKEKVTLLSSKRRRRYLAAIAEDADTQTGTRLLKPTKGKEAKMEFALIRDFKGGGIA